MPRSRVLICGVEIDNYSLDEVVRLVVERAQGPASPGYVVTPNAQHIVLLQRDEHFRRIYREALLVVPDGVPLVWAARLLGTPLRGRVNGTDLFEALCRSAAEQGLGVFFLGGRPGSAARAAQALRERHPTLRVVGIHCPPYGFEKNAAETAATREKIIAAAPDLLFAGLGTPKQEQWMRDNCRHVGVPVSVGIGGSFELVSGAIRRAPKWMQRTGLEWLYRLLKEPGRLWKRYLVGNSLFVWLVLKQAVRNRGGQR